MLLSALRCLHLGGSQLYECSVALRLTLLSTIIELLWRLLLRSCLSKQFLIGSRIVI
jgi:hypothetical protein